MPSCAETAAEGNSLIKGTREAIEQCPSQDYHFQTSLLSLRREGPFGSCVVNGTAGSDEAVLAGVSKTRQLPPHVL